MTKHAPHAKAFDLPGWPCPPRVRDIPKHVNSWGFIDVVTHVAPMPLIQDDLGYLWVNGDVIPRFKTPNDDNANPGALVFWTGSGIGLWVHPKSLRYLPSISRLDMKPDEYLPVNDVAHDQPEFIKDAVSAPGITARADDSPSVWP